MSPLHKVVQFREGISKLNDKEFDTFFTKICDSYNKRDLWTTSLFHLLLYQSKQSNDSMVNTINETITNIIDLRKKSKSTSTNKTKTISFNMCASSLISLIASYLNLSEFINFIETNRNIYIAVSCTSTSLTTIKRRMWLYRYKNNYGYSSFQKDNQMNNIKRFKMIKNVELTAPTIIDLQNKDNYPNCIHFLWQNIHKLTLRNVDPTDVVIINTLKTLKFNHLKLYQLNMNKCVSFNPLVQFIYDLNICGVYQLSLYNLQQNIFGIQSADNYNIFNTMKTSLNALCLHQISAQFNHDIISSIGDGLESLHIISDELNEVLPNNHHKTYYKLKELCVYNVDVGSIKYVLNNADKLERLHMSASDDYDWNRIMDILMDAFKYNIRLKYIGVEIINVVNEVESFMNRFMECLNGNEFEKRNQFKLRLNVDIEDVIAQYFTLNMMNILSAFKRNINDFSLIISSSWIEGTFGDFEECIRQIERECSNDYQVIIGTEYVAMDQNDVECWIRHVTISNKHCAMCSFNERWMMECDNCQQFISNIQN